MKPKGIILDNSFLIEIMDFDEGKFWAQSDCEYCAANLALARKLGKARLLVRKDTRDIVGMEARP
jgi:hypothetical protein